MSFKGSNEQSGVAKAKYPLIPNNNSVPRNYVHGNVQSNKNPGVDFGPLFQFPKAYYMLCARTRVCLCV